MATGNVDQDDPFLALASAFTSSTEADENDESSMSLVDHLEELRWRIIKAIIAVVIGAIVAFIFREQVAHFLTAPLPKDTNPLTKGQIVVTGLAEGFTVYLMISIAVGVIFALPVILYQAWAFMAPGLYENEKKYAVPFIFVGIILFSMGVTLGYIVLRYPIDWLVHFASGTFTELISANSYFSFVAFFILVFGLIFEIPLVLTFLAQVGLVTSDTLRKKRSTAHIGMWIASTFLTPGADIYSPIILGAAMSFLYELTIFFIRFIKK